MQSDSDGGDIMDEDPYESIKLGGGLKISSFIGSAYFETHSYILVAASTSYGDILLVSYSGRTCRKKIIPWRLNSTPVAMHFKGHCGKYLLVAGSDGSVVDIPLNILDEDGFFCDIKYDANVFIPESSRGNPTAIVWWETAQHSSIGILGTELGELCFLDLETGREVGGTYIPGAIQQLQLCHDLERNSHFLVITGRDHCMWFLLLQKKSSGYSFPLDLSCEKRESRTQLPEASLPSRFKGFKEMSVNKLFSFKQRMTEARLARKKKPVSVSRGVGTDDLGNSSPEKEVEITSLNCTQEDFSTSQNDQPYLAKPQPHLLMGMDVDACQYDFSKDRYQVTGYLKGETYLLVSSYDGAQKSSKYYLDNIYPEYVVQSDVTFLSTNKGKSLSIVSNYFAEIKSEHNKSEYLLQEISFAAEERILKLYGCSAFEEFLSKSEAHFEDIKSKRGFMPAACIVITTKNIYIVQTRYFVGALLIDKILKCGTSAHVKKFAKTFRLDSSYFEFAADYEISRKRVMEAIDLYKYAGVSNLKYCLRMATSGAIREFLRYWKNIVNSRFVVDFSDEEKCIISSLGAIAYLYLIVCPASVSGCNYRAIVFGQFLKFLTEDTHYDKILILTLAIYCWRWGVVQHLSRSQGLNLEKLHLLFNGLQYAAQNSHILNNKQLREILSKSNQEGYSACLFSSPMSSVILIKPSLARKLMAFVTMKIDTMSKLMLRKFAVLFDPSNVLLRPFLWSSFVGRHHQLAYNFNSETDEAISLENIVDLFLFIIIKINELDGWKYDPDLLNVPLSPIKMEGELGNNSMPSKTVSGGYNYSAVICNASLYMNGSRCSYVLGNGCNQSITAQYVKGFDSCLAQQIQSTIKNCSEESVNEEIQDDFSDQEQHKTVAMRKVDYFNCFRVLSVSCGHQHVIATTDNGIYGWGKNSYGQLGIGTRNNSLRPILIESLVKLTIVQISCGQYHTLAVTQEGRLYAWGWGLHGQLANGSISDCLKPQLVSALESVNIVSASPGYAHSIALDDKGVVYAWGCGVYGQIGKGDKNKAPFPVVVNLPSPAYSITTGYFQNLAATEDNRIYSWGEHASCLKTKAHLRKKMRMCMEVDEPEQSSVQSEKATTSQASAEVPDEASIEAAKLDDGYHLQPREVFRYSERIKQMATGATHSMVLTADGKVFTWGRNINGQIGCGSRIDVSVPHQIKPGFNFEDIAAGSDFSLAVDVGGQIWGWGSNLCSQLGIKINKEQENCRPFVLKTAKRLVKLPKTNHTNVLSPLEVTSFPLSTTKMAAVSRKMDESVRVALSNIHSAGEEPNPDSYSAKTLHNSLVFLYPHYTIKKIEEILLSCNGHQALAAIYCKDKQYKKAMHHQLLSISEYAKRNEGALSTNGDNLHLEVKDGSKIDRDATNNEDMQDWFVKESSHVLDFYLKLQTQESEAGIKSVLTEGIASWLEFSLPTVHLEKLLLRHMPSAMYPLAMVLFGDESINKSFTNSELSGVDGFKCGLEQLKLESGKSAACNEKPDERESVGSVQSQRFSSNLSREFCFRMCDSLIGQMEKFKEKGNGFAAQKAKPLLEQAESSRIASKAESLRTSNEVLSDEMENMTVTEKIKNSGNSDQGTWVFTCGHAFGCKEFKEDILPRLEQTVISVPDQLGKAARVILDQFHGEDVLMACPNCALAHLSIQLSKHVKKEEFTRRVV